MMISFRLNIFLRTTVVMNMAARGALVKKTEEICRYYRR